MLLICVTGMPGSGKSIVVNAARSMKLPVYAMGDVIREETLKRGLLLTPKNMNMIARMLRDRHGEGVVAEKTWERIIRDKPGEIVVIDGVRSLAEKKFFEDKGRVIMIAVHASPKTRYKRLLARRRPGDPVNWEEFVERDLTELSLGIGNVIALADYMIINEGEKEQAYNAALRILSSIMKEDGYK